MSRDIIRAAIHGPRRMITDDQQRHSHGMLSPQVTQKIILCHAVDKLSGIFCSFLHLQQMKFETTFGQTGLASAITFSRMD